MFLVILAVALSGYLGWRYTQPELNGHWHIIPDDSKINPGISTLDISWDNVVRADKFRVGGSSIGGPLDRFHRNIFLFPTCLSLELNLSWKGDTLILTDARPYPEGEIRVLKAVFIPKGMCTAEEDHFLPSKHQISLPMVGLDEITSPYQANSLGLILPPKSDGESFTITDLYGRDLDSEQLLKEAEIADVKNATNAPPMAVSIFANEEVSSVRIEEIREVFFKEGKGRRVYWVKKKFDVYGQLQFLWTEL